MGNHSDDEFREKPSWRDLDRRRDRSRHVASNDISIDNNPRWVRKQILREADKLFQGNNGPKKLSPEQQKALNEVHKTFGTNKFSASVKRYLKEYGLPDDWGTLLLLLDFTDVATIIEAIQGLKDLYPRQGLQEQQGFRSKLNIISMTSKDEKLRYFVEQTKEEI